MSRFDLNARKTPAARTPDSGVVRVASEGRASRSVARALELLVERLISLGADHEGASDGMMDAVPASPEFSDVRVALRQLAARSRDGAMLCRVVGDTMMLDGVPVDRQSVAEEPLLSGLQHRLAVLDIGSITVREGAAPGELFALGRLLAESATSRDIRSGPDQIGLPPGLALTADETPTTVLAVSFAGESRHELMRTWSVLVTRSAPGPLLESTGVATGSGPLARFTSARTDEAATGAVRALRDVMDDAQRRGDAVAIERIARACLTHVTTVGDLGGRLAVEGALRHLLSAPMLELLAIQLPHSTDRGLLLQLFARAGDAGVNVLVRQLMTTDDSLSRRRYFDSVVAMDIATGELLDALNDSRWFVVRNAAALLGEMGVDHADDTLIPLLRHADGRIRIAAARALMRLRTVTSLQALHAVILDPHAEVRRLSAMAFGLAGATVGGGIKPPAARLASALDRETDDDVASEMLAALGKIGSADAVQRLLRIALPATPDMSDAVAEPRASWMRVAALDALVRARGHQVQPLIDSLKHDADANVAAAAASLPSRVANE